MTYEELLEGLWAYYDDTVDAKKRTISQAIRGMEQFHAEVESVLGLLNNEGEDDK